MALLALLLTLVIILQIKAKTNDNIHFAKSLFSGADDAVKVEVCGASYNETC